jgi:hypothetical protein
MNQTIMGTNLPIYAGGAGCETCKGSRAGPLRRSDFAGRIAPTACLISESDRAGTKRYG